MTLYDQQKAAGEFRARVEKSPKEEQEHGKGKKEFAVCKVCEAVYYHKGWHHGFADFKHLKEDREVRFVVCPACQMIKDNKFEGRVAIQNVPVQYKDELLRNIKNTGQKEYERDPLDRIIKSEVKNPKSETDGYAIEVTTTENQLARNIARQVERAYKNIKSEISWSKEENVARIIITFL